MGSRYVLYLPTVKGLYRSMDSAKTWEPWGPPTICPKNLAVNRFGDIFAVGEFSDSRSLDMGQTHRGLFVLRNNQENIWKETMLVERFSKDTGRSQTPTGPLAVVSDDQILVGTGCGVWECTDRGNRCIPVGPGLGTRQRTLEFGRIIAGISTVLGIIMAITTLANVLWLGSSRLLAEISAALVILSVVGLQKFRANLGSRVSFEETSPVYSLAVSHSRYGEVDPIQHPLILIAGRDKMYSCIWNGPIGLPRWFSPYSPPNDSLNNLVEFGDNIAAWTSHGVFVNWDARNANWQQLVIKGEMAISHRPLIASVKSPEDKRIWCINGPQMIIAEYESRDSVGSRRVVWDEDLLREGAPFEFAYDSSACTVTPPVFSPFFKDDGMAFAISFRHGVLKSTDGGLTWCKANEGIASVISAPIILTAPCS